MKQKLLVMVSLLATSLLGTSDLLAQGSTTSSMNGRVLDAEGQPVPGATVIAIHEPTGSQFGNVTDVNGNYRLNNMNVGGPYSVSISFVGLETYEQRGVFLDLGQTFRLNAELTDQVTELEEIEVLANRGDIFDGNRTGSETIINERAIMTAPTVDRNLQDFTRLTPQANSNIGINGALSFAGLNNRYNSIYIDGAANNDLFGLANSGTNGGQTGISPISIDALEQFQVVLAPYDVKMGGFAGGGINVVTRSGSNEFEGSAYYLLTNQNLTGKTPGNEEDFTGGRTRDKLPDFANKTYGFRVGGPIVKNKLFFFTNVEIQRDETPHVFDPGNWDGDSGTGITNLLSQVTQKLQNTYGYDPGDFINTASTIDGEKFLVRLDYNLSQNHKLMARYHFTKATQTGPSAPSSRSVYSQNSNQFFPSITNSGSIEWKANMGNTSSNNLIFGVTTVRDDRDVTGQPFPAINITDGVGNIFTGAEPFSHSNVVNQDVITLTNNFTLFKGDHTITIGTHNELFSILNIFLPLHPPEYSFANPDKFLVGDSTGRPEAFLYLYGHEQGNQNIGDDAVSVAADFSTVQLGFYAQDEWQVNEKFKFTYGLRVDIPIFLDQAPDNPGFNNSTVPMIEAAGYDLEGATSGQLPDPQIHWAPRFGFNWDVKGDKTSQLRGGMGVFTSRIPYVWPGGVYLRNGLTSGFTVLFDGAGFGPPGVGGVPFEPDLNSQPFIDVSPTGDVDLFAKKFKYPQIFRTSLGLDQQLPWWGLIGTIDLQYTKKVNDVLYTGVNKAKNPIGNLTGGADSRPIFGTSAIDPTYNYITLATNTNKGFTFNGTIQITKPFDNGFTGSFAYSSTTAKSVYDNTVFINSSQWQEFHSLNGRNYVSQPGNGNFVAQDELQSSQFNTGSRFLTWLGWRKEYLNFTATTISVVYNAQQGLGYSYVYSDNDGQLNNDDPNLDEPRNLVYVPRTAGDINLIDFDFNGDGNIGSDETAAAQWSALDSYISNDDYLKDQRGSYAGRNEARMPYEHIIDLKFIQEFFIAAGDRRHTLAISFDIFNFTNMLNKEWGQRYFIGDNQNFELITLRNGGDLSSGVTTTPDFTFRDPGEPWDLVQSGTTSSRWSARFGARYTF